MDRIAPNWKSLLFIPTSRDSRMAMPPIRQTQSSRGFTLPRSWTFIGFTFIAVQLVIFLVTFTHFEGGQRDDDIKWEQGESKLYKGGIKVVQIMANDIRFSVEPVGDGEGGEGSKMMDPCIPQLISPRYCLNERRGNSIQPELERETCTFELKNVDIVFGVWHSLATEGRLQPLLETWGAQARIVLLASTVGAKESKLFQEGEPGSRPHLLDTGIVDDDYFSTLGKAFVGLRLMLKYYPSAKWFVVLGDDNFVLLENYLNVLSAFDPEEPWAISRMVYREKFGCKVAGGASVITSRALTEELSPHLEPWYQGVLERSEGNVNEAAEEDKFHDISFQRLVEKMGHRWVHLAELLHEPPGTYFNPRLGARSELAIPTRPALFHYVPGRYMHYLNFLSTQACICSVPTAEINAALAQVAVGVYSPVRRLSRLDEKQIAATWGSGMSKYRFLEASGRDHRGVKGDVDRLQELSAAFPEAGWLLLLPVEHYLVVANLALRIQELDKRRDARSVMISGTSARLIDGGFKVAANDEGALLVGQDLVKTVLKYGDPLSGGVFPIDGYPGDRDIFTWARTISKLTVLEDPGLVRRLPSGGEEYKSGCPATFPMEPDLADLKPEFTISESASVVHVTRYLMRAVPERTCSTRETRPKGL